MAEGPAGLTQQRPVAGVAKKTRQMQSRSQALGTEYHPSPLAPAPTALLLPPPGGTGAQRDRVKKSKGWGQSVCFHPPAEQGLTESVLLPVCVCLHAENVFHIFHQLKKIKGRNSRTHEKYIKFKSVSVNKVLLECSHARWRFPSAVAELSGGHMAYKACTTYSPALSRKRLLTPALDWRHLKGWTVLLLSTCYLGCPASSPFFQWPQLLPVTGGPPQCSPLGGPTSGRPISTPVPLGSAVGRLTQKVQSKSWDFQGASHFSPGHEPEETRIGIAATLRESSSAD